MTMLHKIYCAACGNPFHYAKDCPLFKIEKSVVKSTIGLWFCLASFFTLPGCAFLPQSPSNPPQIITPAMVFSATEPTPPDPATADQRDVAIYILQLREWGRTLVLQLKKVEELIEVHK